MSKWSRPILWLVFGLSVVGCSFNLSWLEMMKAHRALGQQDYPRALDTFKAIVDRDPDAPIALEAAREGATVAHLQAKNYGRAVEFYKRIVLRSQDPEERKSAQRSIAQIHFDSLHDYDQAVLEYEKLLKLDLSPSEFFRYRLNLAKSHFYLNNLDQSINEIDVILSATKNSDEVYEAKILKANTEVSAKRLREAAQIWQSLLTDFPERSKKENIALNLAVCFEEMKDFAKAIQVLEGMRNGYAQPEFLDLRIQRLKERRENLPGAQGLKR